MLDERRLSRINNRLTTVTTVRDFRRRYYADYIWLGKLGKDFRDNIFKDLIAYNPNRVSVYTGSNRAGIYFLYNEDEVVYIGKSSTSMSMRLISHSLKDWEYTHIHVYCVDNLADIDIAEMYFINLHTPKYNTDCKRVVKPTLELLGLNAIIVNELSYNR